MRLIATMIVMLAAVGCRGEEPLGPNQEAADTTQIVVDNGVSYQTVAGFGGTTLLLTSRGVDNLGPYRNAAIQRTVADVGISLGSLQVGVVEAPATATDRVLQRGNDNADPMVANPAGFNFADLDFLRDKFLVPAAAYGYSDLTLGPLLDYRVPLSWLKDVRPIDYSRYLDEAAENVLAVVRYWRTTNGVTPSLIQLFNEPTTGNTEIGSTSLQEIVDLVKRIGARLQAEGFGQVKFLVPNEETIPRSIQVAQALLNDPAARPYVGVIGFHAYPVGSVYSSVRRVLETSGQGAPDNSTRQELEQLRALGQQFGVPVWFTEVTEGVGITDFPFDAIENVIARAIHIHDTFRYAGASAFFGMNTIWDSRSHAEHFAGRGIPFLTEQSGMVLVDVDEGRILTTGMAYAVGHYARWIRRGAIRIEATSDRARVIVSAFRDPPRGRLVVVTVNNEAVSQLLRIQVQGAAAQAPISGEVSYQTTRWEPFTGVAPTREGEIQYVAPARSVVTIAIPIE